ncbi:MAG: type II toxin-antitoxin system HicB family antitoxin [Candidatus Diapherotrites archaeon]|nr:type II toxin-antitoxin system HicB family antitoxin [Candidatus Diapherotrites archaeon]
MNTNMNKVSSKFRVVLSVDEDGFFIAECLDLPGCVSDGKTKQDALENIKEAIEGYLESLAKHGEKIPNKHAELITVRV